MTALPSLLSAVLAASFQTPITAAPDSHLQCRCQPSQPCWPSSDTWSTFSQTVGGRLIATLPPAYECHDPHYDGAKCKEIQEGYFYDTWRQLQPGAVQQTNWETLDGKGCLGFNKTTPCHQGAVPVYSVKASNIEDVQNTVRFAAKHNIRLVVKNTGHDYIGRSSGAHSINLWVYFMKGIRFDDNFVPEGASSGTAGHTAIILGSGVLWKDAYKAADEHNVIVVGGADPTVGTSGGYCQGGGHSPISPHNGLCVDNVLQYKVVTADGELKVANAFQNTDLFWALRGGGGGTFGVVVEAIYKTHPPLKGVSYAAHQVFFNTTETRRQVINTFLSHQTQLSDAGWSGYAYFQKNFMALMYYMADADAPTANTSISPLMKSIGSIDGVFVRGDLKYYPTFYANFKALQTSNSTNAGANTLLGSRLIPRRNFESAKGAKQLTDALLKAQDDLTDFGNPDGGFITHLVAGGRVREGNSVETSVLPAWRKALIHIVLMTGWTDETPLATQKVIARKITAATQHLRDITPGSGAYINEADYNEPNWQTNFFGANYPRLKTIKKKVDPQGVFVCHHCVGSEDWNEDFTCRRR
ncbi:hypothetical protein B0O80DRAFT_476760 [Mortierella sp. GBAus27b]|nr:hypothetical protein B0O80DRAFT_476760 [Mortierella sp. GBAus27b]